MIPPPIWKAGTETLNNLRMASPSTANTMHTISAIEDRSERHSFEELGRSVGGQSAHTIMTFRGPIVAKSSMIISEGLNSTVKFLPVDPC